MENVPQISQLLLAPLCLGLRQLQDPQGWTHDQLYEASQMLLILCPLVQGCQGVNLPIAAPIPSNLGE